MRSDILKKKISISIILILCISLILIGCTKLAQKPSYPTLITDNYNGVDLNKINQYKIDIEFHPEEKSYSGKQTVTYVNNTGKSLDLLYFHLYPNAFRKEETSPFLFDDFRSAYPSGFEPGYINFKKVSIKGEDIKFLLQGKGDTILKLPLSTPLAPDEKVDIYMEYTVKLPPSQDRFGYGNKSFNFGNWYPIAAVYDDKGWNLDPYYSIGDPFYSDVSNYFVVISTPKDMVVASSGNIISEKIEDDRKIWNIEGKLLRDFAWVASEHFIKREIEVDGTLVKAYFFEDNNNINDFVMEVGEKCISTFNRIFGKYPYGQYSIVATSFPSGMEYPGIVFIGDKYYNKASQDYLEIVIVHETAHQWWYGVVGNDEIDEAWLDESLATYSETIYIDENYGNKAAAGYYNDSVENYYRSMKSVYGFDDVVLKPLSKFKDWNDYGPLAYARGAMFLNQIRENFGKETLYSILNKYYNSYRFLNATTEDFVKVSEEVTGASFEEMTSKWLYGKD